MRQRQSQVIAQNMKHLTINYGIVLGAWRTDLLYSK